MFQGPTVLPKTLSAVLLCAGLWLAPPAQAGRNCDAEQAPSSASITRGLALAERTLAALQASGQRVVLLARAGQDLGAYGLHYSHLGLAYQDAGAPGGPVWRVLHKLNHCGTANAEVYRQGLGEFFLDTPWRYEAAWAVPTPEVQDRLLALLRDPARATRMHTRPYSLVSYAWATRYQQSNQWALETLAAALAPAVDSRADAQAWLQSQGYEPSALTIRPITRLGGRATKANVAFDDHPSAKRFSDRIETVTVDSIFSWLQRAQLAAAPVQIAL